MTPVGDHAPVRQRSEIDAVADDHLADWLALDPVAATEAGVEGYDDRWPDYSPDGAAARDELAARTLARLAGLTPTDDVDRATVAAMQERLGLIRELHQAGLGAGHVRVIASPVQELRETFDLAPTATEADWVAIAARLNALPAAVTGYLAGIRDAQQRGTGPARRQLDAAAEAADRYVSPDANFFADFVAQARPDGDSPSPGLAATLDDGVQAATRAYRDLVDTVRTEIAPRADAPDGCGREHYQLWSRQYLGATIDLDDAYAWGLDELARVEAEAAEVAEQIVPGGGLAAAIDALNADPARQLHSVDALQAWMQETSDRAVAELGRDHFDIPEPIRRLECMIAPTAEGGIYYTGPSEDLSRPGRMWWSVPDGVTTFTTWQEMTTVFHEGVPGHHLQIGQTVLNASLLNRWRRLGCWVSGHGEGWALYAERLMAELGYLDDPGDRLGMLDAARFRAARVVVDIGTHCGFSAPDEVGGGRWDAAKMLAFLTAHCTIERERLEFEQLRYLGWPGQAPAYKLGERLWRDLRDEVRQAAPDTFSLKDFHRRALAIGSVGLDVLAAELRS